MKITGGRVFTILFIKFLIIIVASMFLAVILNNRSPNYYYGSSPVVSSLLEPVMVISTVTEVLLVVLSLVFKINYTRNQKAIILSAVLLFSASMFVVTFITYFINFR